MTPEGVVEDAVGNAASSFNSRLLRNNSGVLFNKEGTPVRYGLGNISKRVNDKLKSGDQIGWTSVVITPDMVGKTVAVFTNIEVKSNSFKIRSIYPPKSREAAQERFCALVRSHGGFAAIVNSEHHYKMVMQFFIDSLKR